MGYGLPSKQTVNAAGGRLQARSVKAGCQLWTLDEGRTVRTTVTDVAVTKVREVVEVVTGHLTFTVAADQMLGTPTAGCMRETRTERSWPGHAPESCAVGG